MFQFYQLLLNLVRLVYFILGFFTSSPTSHSMIKTLSIGRMDNFKTFLRMAILVQMPFFRDKTQKPRAITY